MGDHGTGWDIVPMIFCHPYLTDDVVVFLYAQMSILITLSSGMCADHISTWHGCSEQS